MKPIFINSSPNTETDDVKLAFKQLLSLGDRTNEKVVEGFEKEMESFYNNEIKAIAFDSARSSFFQLLKQWKIGEGDEILVPAFTCVVIVNPILWVGAKPIYVDIDKDTLNMNLEDLKKKITPKSKVILAQHTFGLPMDMEKVMNIAKENNLKVVEDCAHSLGISYQGKQTGAIGDAAVLTFGISKVISGVRGGMLLIKDEKTAAEIKINRSSLPHFPAWYNFRNILNPIIWYIITPIYYLGIGKFSLGRFLIIILQKLKIVSIDNIVEKVEESGQKPVWLSAKMSGNLATLARHQFKKLDKLNSHRREIAQIYAENLNIKLFDNCLYLRFPLFVNDKKKAINYCRERKVILGDWYKSILHIPKKNYKDLLYSEGSCPTSEYAAEHLINLPTFIKVNKTQANYVAKLVERFRI